MRDVRSPLSCLSVDCAALSERRLNEGVGEGCVGDVMGDRCEDVGDDIGVGSSPV